MKKSIQNNKLKILIKAHEISSQGSECIHACLLINELSKFHDITVVSSYSNQFGDVIYDTNLLCKNINIVRLSYPIVAYPFIFINRFFKFFNSSIGLPLLYFNILKLWELKVFRYLSKCNINYDVIHVLNHISYRTPGYLDKLKYDYLLVHGPISGVYNIPSEMFENFSIKNMFRTLFNNITIRNSRIINYYNNVDVLLHVNKYDNFLAKDNAFMFPDIGFNFKESYLDKSKINKNGKINAIVIGRVEEFKGYNILENCFSSDSYLREKFNVSFYGSVDASVENAPDNFHFYGKVKNDLLISILRESHLLIHMSLKEATSLTIIEALSLNCDVVCHEGFGADYIKSSKLFKLPLKDFESSVVSLSSFLSQYRFSSGGFSDLDDYNYLNLAKRLSSIYEKNINNS